VLVQRLLPPEAVLSLIEDSDKRETELSYSYISIIMRHLALAVAQLVLAWLAAANPSTIPEQASYADVAGQLSNLYGANETRHTNNWAVLVCASRYWFNYRVSDLPLLAPGTCRRRICLRNARAMFSRTLALPLLARLVHSKAQPDTTQQSKRSS
jgi:hypothetical protein